MADSRSQRESAMAARWRRARAGHAARRRRGAAGPRAEASTDLACDRLGPVRLGSAQAGPTDPSPGGQTGADPNPAGPNPAGNPIAWDSPAAADASEPRPGSRPSSAQPGPGPDRPGSAGIAPPADRTAADGSGHRWGPGRLEARARGAHRAWRPGHGWGDRVDRRRR